MRKGYLSHLYFVLIDFVLLNVAFFGINYGKRGTFELAPLYVKLLIAFYAVWLFVSLFTNKFRFDFRKGYQALVLLLGRSTIYILYCVSLMVYMLGLHGYSRLQVFGTCGLFFMGELTVFSIWYRLLHLTRRTERGVESTASRTRPGLGAILVLSVSDFLLVTGIFFAMNYLKRGTFTLSSRYEGLLLLVYGLWFATALMTRKFDTRYRNYFYAMAQWVKAVAFMAATMAVLIFAFRLFYYSRLQVFGFFALLIAAESVLYLVYYTITRSGRNGKDIESLDEVKAALRQEDLSLDVDIDSLRARLTSPVRDTLREAFSDAPEVFAFLDETLDLSHIIRAETTIAHSRERIRLTILDEHPTRLLINSIRINDIRWLNRYFLEAHRIILPGGYFVGKAHTIALHHKDFFEKYPKYFRHIFYWIDFLFRRVLPKLPVTKKIYFAVTKGRNRAISRAETLGRLCFCGFSIVAEREIGNELYFIAQKMKTSSVDENPSYGPLVRLNRIGAGGHNIVVYKFRTMHPYSEYLQEYVLEKNSLQPGGKFRNDFRVTALGRLMRRAWLDELPMLYNWIRGDLNLVGVRPLSYQYFSMYPDDLRELRKKVVPGLIPPFYADLPETFDEICESERRYINAFLAHPVKTQWVYFWKAVGNIVFKGARSG